MPFQLRGRLELWYNDGMRQKGFFKMFAAAKAAPFVALVACAAGGWACQRGGAARAAEVTAAPSPAAEMIVAGLGGFRGIAAEVVWFRADRLQDEGRYAELAQLAAWLTFLEPHTPEVWAYTAWNLAYNVSVMMPTHADRWRWVDAGLKLLRDDGLHLNPGDPVLYKELAWMFLLKLGGPLDEAGGYYRAQWKAIVEGYEKTGELEKIGLEKARMDAVDAEYGRQDWTHPYASALYWAARGLESARKLQHRAELRQVIYQTLMMETRSEERFAARALKEMRTAYAERPSEMLLQIMVKFKETHGLD
jgi:hypothetical protein